MKYIKGADNTVITAIIKLSFTIIIIDPKIVTIPTTIFELACITAKDIFSASYTNLFTNSPCLFLSIYEIDNF